MITFYDSQENVGLRQIEKWNKNCWINVTTPDQNELDYLVKDLQIPMDFLNDIEDSDERPRIETEDGWTFVIMRIPIKTDDETPEFLTVPLGIVIRGDIVASICFYKNEVIPDFILFTQRKAIAIDNNFNFLLRLFLSSAVWYQKYLKHINTRTKMAENELEKSIRNDELQALLNIEKGLVYFITSLNGNEILLNRLKNVKFRNEIYDEELFEDVEIELKQAITTANVYSSILTGMMDAYASIISNNVNQIMKTLTSITIVLMVPNIIAGYFGMNVPNNLESSPWGFLLILTISAVLAIVIVIFFRKRNFF
jgi:magnesium transporter